MSCQATDWGFGGQKVEGLDVRDFGSFAVATMTLHGTFIRPDTTLERTYQSLCVFRKENGSSLWVAGQTIAPGDWSTEVALTNLTNQAPGPRFRPW